MSKDNICARCGDECELNEKSVSVCCRFPVNITGPNKPVLFKRLRKEIQALKSTLAERESNSDYWKRRHDVLAPLWAENAAENVLLKETISEYAAGWEKMRGGIKSMSSFAGNVRPEEGCRLVCVRAKELLSIKQPSVSKVRDEVISLAPSGSSYRQGFKGIRECIDTPRKKPWEATIRHLGVYYYLGKFATAIEAALEYDRAAIKFFGNTARTNFPQPNREDLK